MKFKSNTVILLITALSLGGIVYWSQRDTPQQEAVSANAQSIFAFQENQVQAFTVTTKQQTLSVARATSGKRDTQAKAKKRPQAWLIKTPIQAPASDASVAYLLNLLATGKSERTLMVPISQQREFGLDQPWATVKVRLNNQEVHQLILGKPDFNHSFLYAQADPPAKKTQTLKVLLVPTAFESAVNRPLSEWQISGKSAATLPPDPD